MGHNGTTPIPTGSEPDPNAEAARWLDEILLLESVYAHAHPAASAPAAAAASAEAEAEAEWDLWEILPMEPLPERWGDEDKRSLDVIAAWIGSAARRRERTVRRATPTRHIPACGAHLS
jgi:hypothetical protein